MPMPKPNQAVDFDFPYYNQITFQINDKVFNKQLFLGVGVSSHLLEFP